MRPAGILAAAVLGAAALLTSGCLSQQERALLLEGPYTLNVDYSITVEDLLRAGSYNWVNHRLASSNFPAAGGGRVALSAVLVPFSPEANLDHAVGDQAALGMRPATLKELLAFGEAYPDVQRKLPVLALGSSVDLEVITYDRITEGRKVVFRRMVPRVRRLYPFLGGGLAGRVAGLEWLSDPAGYGMYYALFVKPQQIAPPALLH